MHHRVTNLIFFIALLSFVFYCFAWYMVTTNLKDKIVSQLSKANTISTKIEYDSYERHGFPFFYGVKFKNLTYTQVHSKNKLTLESVDLQLNPLATKLNLEIPKNLTAALNNGEEYIIDLKQPQNLEFTFDYSLFKPLVSDKIINTENIIKTAKFNTSTSLIAKKDNSIIFADNSFDFSFNKETKEKLETMYITAHNKGQEVDFTYTAEYNSSKEKQQEFLEYKIKDLTLNIKDAFAKMNGFFKIAAPEISVDIDVEAKNYNDLIEYLLKITNTEKRKIQNIINITNMAKAEEKEHQYITKISRIDGQLTIGNQNVPQLIMYYYDMK